MPTSRTAAVRRSAPPTPSTTSGRKPVGFRPNCGARANGRSRYCRRSLTNLERFEGRKTIVLLSEGFVADDSWSEVQRVIGLAARVNARIYTLDARGLAYRGPTALDRAPVDTQQRLLDALGAGDDAINSLAADTGGFVVRNTNNFNRAVATIAEDAGTYYVLGYRPSRAFDGKFHRVSVKVKRSGIDVRARRGYVATPRPAVPTDLAAPKESPVPKQSLPPKESVGPELADTIDPVLPTAIHPGARDNQRPPAGAASSPPAVPTNTAAAAGTELRVRPLASEHTAALAEGDVSSNARDAWVGGVSARRRRGRARGPGPVGGSLRHAVVGPLRPWSGRLRARALSRSDRAVGKCSAQRARFRARLLRSGRWISSS